tara:strand:+ start:69 stop:851 length:783 start_codon:yes stop_codon:yes gene_type:complete
MKKIILFILLIPFVGFSQDHFTDYNLLIDEMKLLKDDDDDKKKKKVHRLEVGLNGGINFAEIKLENGIDNINLSDKLGSLYGGTIVYNFNRFLCIKGDFDIASKGFTMNDVGYTVDKDVTQAIKTADVKQLLNYFDIPAFFHIGFGKKLKFDINFGPYLSFLLENRSNLVDLDGNKVTLEDGALDFALDNRSKIDWGWVGGAGIDYYITKKIAIGFDFLIETGLKVLNGGGNFGEFTNSSRDFDFGVNFLLFEKKSNKLF